MFRKTAALLLVIVLCVCLLPAAATRGDGFDLSTLRERYVILVNADDPTNALYGIEQNADAQCATGSTVKILTCILALEKGNLDDAVTISANAVDFSKYNSLMGLQEGETWKLGDLLYGLMLPSGNDAAVAIAEHIAGSTTAFASMMNEKAAELGMSHSHFVTVHGKDNADHYSTARDMAVLTAYALKNETFRQIVSTTGYTCADATGAHSITLASTNRLLVDATASDGSYTPISCLYTDAIGVKTGDTNAAGKCFIAAAQRGGVTLIAVLLGGTLDDPDYLANSLNMRDSAKDPYNAQRFEDAISVFNYAFKQMTESITVQELIDLGMPVSFSVQVQNYARSDPNSGLLTVSPKLDTAQSLQLMTPFMTALKSSVADIATAKIGAIVAPVSEGDVVGTVEYACNGTVLFTSNLYADRSVAEGVLTTDTSAPASSGSSSGLLGNTVTVDPDGNASTGSGGSVILWVVVGVLVLLVVLFIVFLIAAKIRREKRRKAKAAARRRRQQQLKREQSSSPRYRE